ncbi:recombinase family protein [Gemmatimonas sp.]|uniref:recombinase family protein n=1 Tax=Gemmatimonas sp. TaxID=1962908 RepID=UPI00356B459A
MTERTNPRVIAYRRVSTDEQSASGAGLDAQAARIAALVGAKGWTLTSTLTDEAVSGGVAPDARPALSEALSTLDAGHADVLIVAKLDRLTRSVSALGPLLDRAERHGWRLVILDADVDTTTAGGRLVANVLGSVAEWERAIIRERTRDALAARKAAGMRLGRPVEMPAEVRARVAHLAGSGLSLRAVAAQLTPEGVPTTRGGAWHASTVRAVVRSLALDAEAVAAA